MTMNIERFRATRVFTADLARALPEQCVHGEGIIYIGDLFIEMDRHRPTAYFLTIGNASHAYDGETGLAQAELDLYNFAVSQEYIV